MGNVIFTIFGWAAVLCIFVSLAADAYLFFKEVTKVKRPGIYAAFCYIAALVLVFAF